MNKLTFVLIDQLRLNNCLERIKQLPTDLNHPLVVTIQEQTRSLSQNAKLWACLNDISEHVVWHSQKLSSEDWKHILTAALKGQRSAPGINGGFAVLGQSTSRMTVGEMSELIEMMSAFGTEQGVRWSDESRQALEWARRFGETKRAA
ncbi:recombination protein NinB [Ewingella americana]